MKLILNTAKGIYRCVVPLFIRKSPAVRRFKTFVRGVLLSHNSIYNAQYYLRFVEGPAANSSDTISNSIISTFNVKSVVDVGCGTGALLEAIKKKGCETFGFEYSDAAIEICRARHLDVQKFNLESDVLNNIRKFDLAISTEVAEHLPAKFSDRYVEILCRLADVIVFTAAPPGQGGDDHVNEQLPSYWIAKFNKLGFDYSHEITKNWRVAWKNSNRVASWYYDNLMVFRRA